MVESKIPCPCCKRTESTRAEKPLTLADIDLFICGSCGARVAWGKLQMRQVVEPFTDDKGVTWCRTRYQDPRTKRDLFVVDTDAKNAALWASNVLSLVIQ